MTQDTQLFSGSIRENLLFVSPGKSDAQCLEVLRKAACDTLLARADQGLARRSEKAGSRFRAARSSGCPSPGPFSRPDLLVFDEATSSLDSLTEEEISGTIREVAESHDAITVLIAHRLSTVMHADRIYVLEPGQIVEEGRHDDLLEQKGLYYAMWRQQVGERRPLAASAPSPRLVTA